MARQGWTTIAIRTEDYQRLADAYNSRKDQLRKDCGVTSLSGWVTLMLMRGIDDE